MRPNGIALVTDFRKPDYTHRSAIDENGDYKICFDNRRSSFSPKVVYFEISIENEEDDERDEFKDLLAANPAPGVEGDYEVQVEDIEESLRGIKDRVKQSRHFLGQIRNFELRDRSVAEHNFDRVNFWSLVQVVTMLIGKSR
jgi:protein ERP2